MDFSCLEHFLHNFATFMMFKIVIMYMLFILPKHIAYSLILVLMVLMVAGGRDCGLERRKLPRGRVLREELRVRNPKNLKIGPTSKQMQLKQKEKEKHMGYRKEEV